MSSVKNRKINVVALFPPQVVKPSPCEYLRVFYPFNELNKHSDKINAGWASAKNAQALSPKMEAIDIFVFPRVYTKMEQAALYKDDEIHQALKKHGIVSDDHPYPFIQVLQAYGKKAVYETDDDYSGRYRDVGDTERTAMKVAAACDAGTVTNEHLAGVLRRAGLKRTFVLPNFLNLEIINNLPTTRKFDDNKIVISLAGSPTHQGDWSILKSVLPAIMEEYPQVRLLLGGMRPHFIGDLPDDRVYYYEYAPYETYLSLTKGADIVLCPVDPSDRFNLSKSGLKALEGMATGNAVIATDMSIYRDVIKKPIGNGLLVKHTEEAWHKAISQLVRDAEVRTSVARAGTEWITKHGDIAQNWQLWENAYLSIMED